jgi:hypothetical protein
VWKLGFSNAPPLALKLAHPLAPLALESQVLATLRRRSPVPDVLAVSPAAAPTWIALEWCGDLTLDDVAQTASPAELRRLGLALAAAVAAVEAAFAPLDARWQTQSGGSAARVAALREQAAGWVAAAPAALAWLLGAHLDHTLKALLVAALAPATHSVPTLGSLDYNARNVVLDGDRLSLIDFAAVGADWPERRFVQYGTAIGASLVDGGFASAIDAASVAAYAAEVAPLRGVPVADVAHRIDAHDLLLLLTAAHHLRMIEAGQAHPDRAAAWANVPRRRAQLLALLRRQLVSDGPAEDFRAQLRSGQR